MSWRPITAKNITGRFTASEQAMLNAASGSSSKLQERLEDAVATFVGAMNAAGWSTKADGSISDSERNLVMSLAVWEWIKDFPKLDTIKTKERKEAYDEAIAALGKIRNRTYGSIEPPQGVDKSTGNWNSKPKLMMRTDPHPQPLQQLQLMPTPAYANPNSPGDDVPVNSPGMPQATTQVRAIAENGTALVFWNPVVGSTGYLLYRSSVSGQELTATNPTPVATLTAMATNWNDNTITAGQWFYVVVTVNGALCSGPSNEAVVTI